jgi:hypothetical protein
MEQLLLVGLIGGVISAFLVLMVLYLVYYILGFHFVRQTTTASRTSTVANSVTTGITSAEFMPLLVRDSNGNTSNVANSLT